MKTAWAVPLALETTQQYSCCRHQLLQSQSSWLYIPMTAKDIPFPLHTACNFEVKSRTAYSVHKICTDQGAQFAAACFPWSVDVPVCVLVVPTGVAVPAKVNSMVPINSAIRAYMTYIGGRNSAGRTANKSVQECCKPYLGAIEVALRRLQ